MSVYLGGKREGRGGEAGAVQEPLGEWQFQSCDLLFLPLPSIPLSHSQATWAWKDSENPAHTFMMEWRTSQTKNKLTDCLSDLALSHFPFLSTSPPT